MLQKRNKKEEKKCARGSRNGVEKENNGVSLKRRGKRANAMIDIKNNGKEKKRTIQQLMPCPSKCHRESSYT
jgi:hypothetical protein